MKTATAFILGVTLTLVMCYLCHNHQLEKIRAAEARVMKERGEEAAIRSVIDLFEKRIKVVEKKTHGPLLHGRWGIAPNQTPDAFRHRLERRQASYSNKESLSKICDDLKSVFNQVILLDHHCDDIVMKVDNLFSFHLRIVTNDPSHETLVAARAESQRLF